MIYILHIVILRVPPISESRFGIGFVINDIYARYACNCVDIIMVVCNRIRRLLHKIAART